MYAFLSCLTGFVRLISVFSHVAVSLLHSPPGTLLLVNLVSKIVAVTCRYCILAHHPSPLSLFIASLTQKWLLLHARVLVASLDPRTGVVTGRIANSLTISVQRLEQEPPRVHLGRTRCLLPHPEHGREGAVTPHREPFATSTGIPVSATAGSTVPLDIKRTPNHNLTTPTLPAELKMKKTLRTQLWNFSRRTT